MNYHNITKNDMNNGDGLRVVLWVAGCDHHCEDCQNPQTWNPNSGIPFDDSAKDELYAELEKDYISGLTISGGDPLNGHNLLAVYNICVLAKYICPNKSIWIYTGYTWEELLDESLYLNDERLEILRHCDVLVDGRYDKDLRDVSLKWRGSSNQRVIDVQKSLAENRIVLWCD